MTTKYAICIQDQEDKCQYVGTGEYSRFSLRNTVQDAMWFDTIDEVRKALTDPEFTKRVGPYTDGTTMPPSLIWSGLGINNARPYADGFINIVKIEIDEIECIYVEDQAHEGRP